VASGLSLLATGRLPDWLIQGLERHGIGWQALQWPEVQYTATPLEVQHRLLDLSSHHGGVYWVFTSPQASRFAAELHMGYSLPPPAGVYSVGRGSGVPLLDLGYPVVWPEHEANSTALAELMTRDALTEPDLQRRYVHWCAPSRRPELQARMAGLAQRVRNISFKELHVYQTNYPDTFIEPHPTPTDVLIQSPGALKALFPWLAGQSLARIWCLGPATATEIDRTLPQRAYAQCLNLEDWLQKMTRLSPSRLGG
jgi:uroporphyrinogen-III synthase